MDGGGAAGHCTLARKDLAEMINLATSTGWEPPGPAWGYRGSVTSSPEASIRLIKFAAAALAAEARGAGDLGERQSLGAGAQRWRERSRDPPAEPKTSVFIFKQTDQLH